MIHVYTFLFTLLFMYVRDIEAVTEAGLSYIKYFSRLL